MTSAGDIGSAIACYNLLSSISLPTVCHNIGEVTSAANIIFLAGKTRRMTSRSYFRHHGTFFPMQGNNHRVMYEDALETLKVSEGIMSSIIVERTKLTKANVKTYFNTPSTISPEALKFGIIHEIKEMG